MIVNTPAASRFITAVPVNVPANTVMPKNQVITAMEESSQYMISKRVIACILNDSNRYNAVVIRRGIIHISQPDI